MGTDSELMLDVGQANELKLAFRRAGYTNAHIKKLCEGNLAEQFLLVINGSAVVTLASFKLALDKTFNPAKLLDSGCTVWRGPATGNGLKGDEDVVLEPDILDFERLILETHLHEDESAIHGEEKMRRVRASKNRQLGGKALAALFANWKSCKRACQPKDSILERLRFAGKIGTVIYFFGITLRRFYGDRCTPCLYFNGREWCVGYRPLELFWGSNSPSAALEGEGRLGDTV